MFKTFFTQILCSLILFTPMISLASSKISAYKIIYQEKEEGTDFYPVTYTVAKDVMRIDDSIDDDLEENGYIIFDLKTEKIYSVSHFDNTILVIERHHYSKEAIKLTPKIIYKKLEGAPNIAGKVVFDYKVYVDTKDGMEKCMDIQIAEGLLPAVTVKLKQYQTVVSGQQVKNVKTIPEEYRTACTMVDLVYNDGAYYEKGLPLQEWHSNNRVRSLKSFNKVTVDKEFFSLPKDYKRFSLEDLVH